MQQTHSKKEADSAQATEILTGLARLGGPTKMIMMASLKDLQQVTMTHSSNPKVSAGPTYMQERKYKGLEIALARESDHSFSSYSE